MVKTAHAKRYRWSGKDFGQGGISVDISAPLDQIPVFFLGSKDDIMSGDV